MPRQELLAGSADFAGDKGADHVQQFAIQAKACGGGQAAKPRGGLLDCGIGLRSGGRGRSQRLRRHARACPVAGNPETRPPYRMIDGLRSNDQGNRAPGTEPCEKGSKPVLHDTGRRQHVPWLRS